MLLERLPTWAAGAGNKKETAQMYHGINLMEVM
jgi:hypothetical protein